MVTDSRKKFKSDVCIDGKRIGAMRQLAKATFRNSFLYIEVDAHEMEFILGLDDTIDPDDLNEFKAKYPLCKIQVYRPIELSSLKNTGKKQPA